MKMLKLSAILFLSVLLVAAALEVPDTGVSADQPNCGSLCSKRCAKAGVQDRCIKYCGICCRECKCVPSGTYGNKHQCPCYRDKRNSKGKPKCP